MSAVAPTSNIIPTINTSQSGAAYLANIDGDCIAGLRLWGAFAPRVQTTPNMTMMIDPGSVFAGAAAPVELGAYTTGTTSTSSGAITAVPQSAFAGLAVGQAIQAWYYGGGIFTALYPVNTVITGLTSGYPTGTVTVSNSASSAQTGAILVFGQAIGTTATGTANGTATVSSFGANLLSGVFPGMSMAGTGVTAGTTVTGVNPTAGTITASATVAAGTNAYTFTVPTQVSNPRIDRVCLNATTGVVSWVPGTAAATPSPPSIPAGYLPLCQLLVTPSTTAITMTSVVADERTLQGAGGSLRTAFGPQATLASAATTDLGSAGTNNLAISGTATISSFGSSASLNNPLYLLVFAGALTLANSTALALPGGQSIRTTAGDAMIVQYLGSGNWDVLFYLRNNGQPTSITGALATLASAATADLGSTGVNLVQITGTTTITSLGSSASTANPLYVVTFAGALQLTANATSLILPGGTSLTTATNDVALALYLGSGNWRILEYRRAAGVAAGTYSPASVTVDAAGNITGIGSTTSGPFTAKYATSSPVALPAAGATAAFAHGFGAQPFGYSLYLHCTGAENGWTVGDEVNMGAGNMQYRGSQANFNTWADATNVYVILNSEGSGQIQVMAKSTGTVFDIGSGGGSWKIVVRAWI